MTVLGNSMSQTGSKDEAAFPLRWRNADDEIISDFLSLSSSCRDNSVLWRKSCLLTGAELVEELSPQLALSCVRGKESFVHDRKSLPSRLGTLPSDCDEGRKNDALPAVPSEHQTATCRMPWNPAGAAGSSAQKMQGSAYLTCVATNPLNKCWNKREQMSTWFLVAIWICYILDIYFLNLSIFLMRMNTEHISEVYGFRILAYAVRCA